MISADTMKTTTTFQQIAALFTALAFALLTCFAQPAHAASPTGTISHLGPIIKVEVQRGDDRLPLYWVNHLQKGDRLIVATDQAQKSDAKWLLLVATVTPVTNLVDAHPFDLASKSGQVSIDITTDDQVPVIVVAPQVRTMFGLHTSFSESADLITDAIRADPQRFVDLQKIDQINHAIDALLSVLDNLVQAKAPSVAIAAVKDLAGRYGVKVIDPDCFKGDVVNTRCVAANIVSSADLTVSSDDIWSAAGPNAGAVKLPTDLFAPLKLISETSSYLVNKYGDNYNFAPSLGQRQGNTEYVQLFSNARFQNGDVKTAYIYVPSWFNGKAPEIKVDTKFPACLTRNEIAASTKGNLPLLNYWHDWKLTLRAHGTSQVVAEYNTVQFKPNSGLFVVAADQGQDGLPHSAQLLDATLTGKFGFADVTVNPFSVMTPTSADLTTQITGLESLVSGEQARVTVRDKNADACISQISLFVGGNAIASSAPAATDTQTKPASIELLADLTRTDPGAAVLEVQQYGANKQDLPVTIYKRRAHLQKITRYDLETTLTVSGDNLDRIDFIQIGSKFSCHPADGPASAGQQIFSCPAELAANAALPDKASIHYRDGEPQPMDVALTKLAARPNMIADGAGAIVTRLSSTAQQWNLSPTDPFVSEDSGIGILLHAQGGYHLSRGNYLLQLKFSDDAPSDGAPFSVPLMSDLTHNELRTKKPVTFDTVSFPTVVNPVWYRVVHQPSGLAGDWLPLNRAVIYLPQLTGLTHTDSSTLVHGSQLEMIDSAGSAATMPDVNANSYPNTALIQCGTEQCLQLNEAITDNRLKVKLHWIDNRLFDVTFPDPAQTATR